MKNGLYLKSETVTYESDYWEVSELIAEHKTRYSWTKNKDEAVSFIDIAKYQINHYSNL